MRQIGKNRRERSIEGERKKPTERQGYNVSFPGQNLDVDNYGS